MEDSNIDPDTEMLAMRRSRRSTAGNRMAVVMAEVVSENDLKDLDDDVDFQNVNDEQDIFESDFESTDEEAEKQAEQIGETEAIQEEKRVKKAAKSRLEKVTAAAHERQKATFNLDEQTSATPTKLRTRTKSNRVQLGTAVDAATGQVLLSRARATASKTRTSKRKHTVLSTSATATRLKEVEKKKASQPRKAKPETKTYTQAELIALALDTEEGNIREHRDYLKNEEEKRKRARVVRTTIQGPKLRWVSKIEEVKIPVEPPPPPPPTTTMPPLSNPSGAYRSVYGPPGSLFTPTTYTFASGSAVKSSLPLTSTTTQPAVLPSYPFSQYPAFQHSAFPVWPPPPLPHQSSVTAPAASLTSIPPTESPALAPPPLENPSNLQAPLTTAAAQTVSGEPSSSTPAVTQQEFRTEKVTKDYLVHELSQQRGGPKPSWAENMQAMFGDHVKWDEVKVFVGKNRPLARPKHTCPITGRQALYLDPRTGVPYADGQAFKVLSALLEHEYVWNPSSGSYMDPSKTLPTENTAPEVPGDDTEMITSV